MTDRDARNDAGRAECDKFIKDYIPFAKLSTKLWVRRAWQAAAAVSAADENEACASIASQWSVRAAEAIRARQEGAKEKP